MRKIRLGIMGFGQIGRQLYRQVVAGDEAEVLAVSDIGRPEILHHLLTRGPGSRLGVTLDGHYLRHEKFDTRLLPGEHPREVPWDLFDVDMVIDATARFRRAADMADHLANGANRVLLSTLPADRIDRVVIHSVNEWDAQVDDRMISAGSGTTSAMAVILKAIGDQIPIRFASMTTVHAYTSDQSLQDYAGEDIRRSRSAAQNIIPNTSEAPDWVAHILPQFAGKVSGYALNVPVQRGSMLDLNLVCDGADVSVDRVNGIMREVAERYPHVVAVADDPIVSSDVIGCTQSVLFDAQATMKAADRIIKVLAWYEATGHATRVLDVARLYAELDEQTAATRRTA
jgi:glyceraldehyde 3-phosphate dehydrogenase